MPFDFMDVQTSNSVLLLQSDSDLKLNSFASLCVLLRLLGMCPVKETVKMASRDGLHSLSGQWIFFDYR